MVQVVSPQNKLQPSSIQLIPIPDLNLKRSMPQDGTGPIWPYFDLIWPHLKIGRRGSNSSKSDDNRAVLLTVDNKDQEGKVLPQSCFLKKIFCIELFFGMGFTVKTQLGEYFKNWKIMKIKHYYHSYTKLTKKNWSSFCAWMSWKWIQRGKSLLLCYGSKSLIINTPQFSSTQSQTK